MKKNRPGQLLKVVCHPADSAALAKLVLHHSSAIGVRSHRCTRHRLGRRLAPVTSSLGTARVKLLFENGVFLRLTAEYEDCLHLARSSGVPLREASRQVEAAAYAQLDSLIKEGPDE